MIKDSWAIVTGVLMFKMLKTLEKPMIKQMHYPSRYEGYGMHG